jgi:hypothetical protein
MGIISSIKARHNQDLKKMNRTDNHPIEHKWKALIQQENFYNIFYGINLKKYREKLALKNSSWNGAVTGYLYSHEGKSFEDWKDNRDRTYRMRKKRKSVGKLQNI